MTDPGGSSRSPGVAHESLAPADPSPSALAFRELFEAHASYVFHTLRRFGVREADLPDQLHEVFVALYRRMRAGQYDASLPPRPYLAATAFRVASDYRRLGSTKREVITDETPVPAGAAPAPDELLEDAEGRALVLAALARVPAERRVVLVMHDIDEHPVPHIAAALEIPLNTAYSRLRLARSDLREAVLRLRAQSGPVTANRLGSQARTGDTP